MIYLKRIFKIILFIILMPTAWISIVLTMLVYPLCIILHYIVYGDFDISLPYLLDKVTNIIFKPLDFLRR